MTLTAYYVDPDDLPADIVDRMARMRHPRDCGSYDAHRTFPPPWPYAGHHRDVDMRVAGVRLAQLLEDLCIPVDEFDVIVNRRLWADGS